VDIRPGELRDLPRLTEIYNYYVRNSPATFDLYPFSVAERQEWFDHYHRDGPHRLLVACSGADILGYATSSQFRVKPAYDTSVETTVYCDPTATGRGVGTALYTALFKQLASDDVHRAFAGIVPPNDASIALHKRFGFTEIGIFPEVGRKFGRYWDVLWLWRPIP
jgi:phosphinothricin acetyltransferase